VKYLRFTLLLIFIPIVINNCYTRTEKTPPNSELIYYTEIPHPFSKSTYFLYSGGWNVPQLEFADGSVVVILQKLLENNFAIREAWNATGEWGCPSKMPTWDQFIIRLEAPDKRIYDFGFTSDSSKVQIYHYDPPCRPIWEYYQLERRNNSYESKN
jgi:hypothetical protein